MIKFTKVRDVKSPSRNHDGDAGLDFFIPENLTFPQLLKANNKSDVTLHKVEVKPEEQYLPEYDHTILCVVGEHDIVKHIYLSPLARILIPSGIRVLIEPKASMLTAANKSGLSANKGLIFTAQIVDTPYTGEVHIGVVNLSSGVWLEAGMKTTQFIHVPIFQDTPIEISNDEYDSIAKNWGTRGSNGFGSGD